MYGWAIWWEVWILNKEFFICVHLWFYMPIWIITSLFRRRSPLAVYDCKDSLRNGIVKGNLGDTSNFAAQAAVSHLQTMIELVTSDMELL